ncbi:regulatory protein, luxR family [Nocardioides terrae]|uniref:Regulatory protein, luxR family n=1 Tax=Nocardioides terrae TaxID=574651 RepID=A0A1I1GT78_9ACTN|nr:helix-turn-helix transcriptional regulator [Nocardioides terrae]SFC13058.1 regulatory protein, luxR family [Nocardioides terrae]
MAPTLPRPWPDSARSGPLVESWQLVRTGSIRRAASELAAALRRVRTPEDRAAHAALLLTCRLASGDLSGAAVAGTVLEPSLVESGTPGVLARLAHAELAAAAGDHERALMHFRRAGRLSDADGSALVPWRSGAALAMVRLGQRPEATELARGLLALAEEMADPWHLAVALRTVASVDPTADALTSLDRSRGLARAADDRRLAAQVDTDLAGMLLLLPGSEHGRTVGLLRAAEDYAIGEALWPLHGRISRLLGRAGERARPLHEEAIAQLTGGERRVAQLAARGLTNRQIAEQLTVTIKGVEWHLSRVYRKLAISSREELVPLLDDAAHVPATA